jgi:hypothetical protein
MGFMIEKVVPNSRIARRRGCGRRNIFLMKLSEIDRKNYVQKSIEKIERALEF